jgi:thiol:disulfide interchange protein DsbD
MYVTLCLLCGLYLIGVYRLPHDEAEDRRVGVGRLIWSFVFLGLGFYLLPGLFHTPGGGKMQPAGKIYDWIDSFLLPDTEPEAVVAGPSRGGASKDAVRWVGFFDRALVQAREKKERIFIDFTGET